jgi:hypothetical protein
VRASTRELLALLHEIVPARQLWVTGGTVEKHVHSISILMLAMITFLEAR